MKNFPIFLIKIYQNVLSPALNSILHSVFGFHFQCRYSPTCSQYTIEQIQKHGTIAGLFLGGKRILSCWGRLSLNENRIPSRSLKIRN